MSLENTKQNKTKIFVFFFPSSAVVTDKLRQILTQRCRDVLLCSLHQMQKRCHKGGLCGVWVSFPFLCVLCWLKRRVKEGRKGNGPEWFRNGRSSSGVAVFGAGDEQRWGPCGRAVASDGRPAVARRVDAAAADDAAAAARVRAAGRAVARDDPARDRGPEAHVHQPAARRLLPGVRWRRRVLAAPGPCVRTHLPRRPALPGRSATWCESRASRIPPLGLCFPATPSSQGPSST